MKRKRIWYGALSVILLLIMLVPATKVSAASASLSIAMVSDIATEGNEFTVAVQVSANAQLASVELTVSYDSEYIECISENTLYSVEGSEVVVDDQNLKDKAVSQRKYIMQFKAKKKGKTSISIDGTPLIYGSEDSTALSVSKKSLSLEVYDKDKKSDNNKLISLYVKDGKLSTKFDPTRTVYELTVPYTKTSVTVEAVAYNSEAKVAVSGGSNLQVGANKVAVLVTSPSGKEREYTIYVNREPKEDGSNEEDPTNGDSPTAGMTPEPSALPSPVKTNTYSVVKEDGLTYMQGTSNYLLLVPFDDSNVPDGYKKISLTLNGTDVVAYAVDANPYQDFLLFYAKQEGKDPGWYQFDQTEGTMQRYVAPEKAEETQGGESGTVLEQQKYQDRIDILGLVMGIEACIIILLLILLVRLIMKQKGYNDELE